MEKIKEQTIWIHFRKAVELVVKAFPNATLCRADKVSKTTFCNLPFKVGKIYTVWGRVEWFFRRKNGHSAIVIGPQFQNLTLKCWLLHVYFYFIFIYFYSKHFWSPRRGAYTILEGFYYILCIVLPWEQSLVLGAF